MVRSIWPSSMARLTAWSGGTYRCDGRLWQSMQSMVRISYWLMSLVNPRVRKTVTTPCASVMPDPGNLLPGRVRGDVFDTGVRHGVPMDAADRPAIGVGTADLDGKADGIRRVGGVALEIVEGAVEIAAEFLRPVTLFARFASGPQIFDGCGDGPGILVEGDGVKLVGTGEFGTDEPVHTGTDMAGHAGHARVRAVVMGRQFGFHDTVAGLAAKLDRFREIQMRCKCPPPKAS